MEPTREILIEQPLTESSSNSTAQNQVGIPHESLFLFPFLFLVIFSVAFLKQTNLPQALYSQIITLKLYYQIPCFRCQFFQRNQYLQCAVQPCLVLNNEAAKCPDFTPQKGKHR